MSAQPKPKNTTVSFIIPRPRIKFDLGMMKAICLADFDSFEHYGELYETKQKEKFFYKDNGAKVLFVAHLDSVAKEKHFGVASLTGEKVVYNAQLDDRLGAYVGLSLLPSLGIECDFLLTDGEETGRSTAKYFYPEDGKEYNWIFSFDRTGTDVVMYDYEAPEYTRLLRESTFKVGIGSFSDICHLTHLGVAGFNFGVGYQDYHSARAHVFLSDLEHMIQNFLHFYTEHSETKMPHDPSKKYRTGGSSYFRGAHSHYGDGYEGFYDPKTNTWNDKPKTEKLFPETVSGSLAPTAPLPPKDVMTHEYCPYCEANVLDTDFYYGQGCCYVCHATLASFEADEAEQALKDYHNTLPRQIAQAIEEASYEN